MARYLNPDAGKFQTSLNSAIYVDKSNLIAKTNALFDTEQRFICMSRPRRFGKTMVMDMLAAYYRLGKSTNFQFRDLNIASHPSYVQHLNKYHVLAFSTTDFLYESKTVIEMIERLQTRLISELIHDYPYILYKNKTDISQVMKDIYTKTRIPFVILIDGWDSLIRRYEDDIEAHNIYFRFLNTWFKDEQYIGLVCMTGILPIKKHRGQLELPQFIECSMTNPSFSLNYLGLTETEVEGLCDKYEVDFERMKQQYGAYFKEVETPIYNPISPIGAITSCGSRMENYWNATISYEGLKRHIELELDSLKEKVFVLMSGNSVKIQIDHFIGDMITLETADEVLTLLVHLGYLSYNQADQTVRIPNQELHDEFRTSTQILKWVENRLKNE